MGGPLIFLSDLDYTQNSGNDQLQHTKYHQFMASIALQFSIKSFFYQCDSSFYNILRIKNISCF